MKEFNWNKFKNENVVVNCKTKEENEDFLNQCEKNNINIKEYENNIINSWELNYKEKTCYEFVGGYLDLMFAYTKYYKEKEYKILDWSDYMNNKNNQNKYDIEKTFKEVNNNIQDGETWENDIFKISRTNNCTTIRRKDGNKYSGFAILDDMKFKLERNKFNFTDAYKFYKQGKEIESLETGYRYKLINGADKRLELFDENWVLSAGFICIEIDGDWYINK